MKVFECFDVLVCGVVYFYDYGIVYCDLKLGNIFFDEGE